MTTYGGKGLSKDHGAEAITPQRCADKKRIEELEIEVNALRNGTEFRKIEARCYGLEEQKQRYKKALEFYATRENYCIELTGKHGGVCIVQADNGNHARQALAEPEEWVEEEVVRYLCMNCGVLDSDDLECCNQTIKLTGTRKVRKPKMVNRREEYLLPLGRAYKTSNGEYIPAHAKCFAEWQEEER